jgi:hypothetical protein
MAVRLLAAILSRMRSSVTSRSNWAKDSRGYRPYSPLFASSLPTGAATPTFSAAATSALSDFSEK